MSEFFAELKTFLEENWAAIVAWFDKLWAFAKETVLKDDSIFADVTVGE
ncbi:MAG: hypothetical protein ACI4GY_07495 [Acutalibacteraceae bacterium]